MKKIKSKLMRVTFLAGAISLMMCGNIFAASTGQIKVGSGSASGWVYGYNSVSGNGTSGYYAESSTSFTTLGNGCGGVLNIPYTFYGGRVDSEVGLLIFIDGNCTAIFRR